MPAGAAERLEAIPPPDAETAGCAPAIEAAPFDSSVAALEEAPRLDFIPQSDLATDNPPPAREDVAEAPPLPIALAFEGVNENYAPLSKLWKKLQQLLADAA